ncbi:MAG: HEAT repeat domain-containing protein [Myxococcaceae bacterium]|nr:HEAT repeat domain-containing protein [Myxococcaceae bacterium]
MQRVWAVALWVSCSAWAAGKTDRGSSLGNAKEDSAPGDAVVALNGLPRPTEAPDVALLRGLIWSFEPNPAEIRSLAIEDLGLLGDTRALNPLAQLVVDPNPMVQVAALRAVALMRHPRAEEILCNVVRHPQLSEKLKLRALEWVVFQRTPTSQTFLQQVSTGPSFSRALQNQAKLLLNDMKKEVWP